MASISSRIVFAVLALALNLAHTASLQSNYNNVAATADESSVARGTGSALEALFFNTPNDLSESKVNTVDIEGMADTGAPESLDVQRRLRRQVDEATNAEDSEIFSNGPGTSLYIHSMPMGTLNDSVEIVDANNTDRDSLNSINDYDDKTGENKLVEEESRASDEKKEADSAPDSVKTETVELNDIEPTADKVGDEEETVSSEEEAVSHDEPNQEEPVTMKDELKSVKPEKAEEPVKSGEEVKLNGEEKEKIPEVKEEEKYEAEDEEDEDPMAEKAVPIAVSEPQVVTEQVELIHAATDDVETLPSHVKTSEESTKGELMLRQANIEGSGDSDDEESTEAAIKIVDDSVEFRGLLTNPGDKNVVDPNEIKITPEDVDLNLDGSVSIDNEDDEPPIHEPSENALEDHHTVHSNLNENHDLNIDNEDPIPDPTATDSEKGHHVSALDSIEVEKDLKSVDNNNDMARNMQVDELLGVNNVVTTTEDVEASGSGGMDVEGSDDISEESDTASPELGRRLFPIKPVLTPTEAGSYSNENSKITSSAEGSDPGTKFPATNEGDDSNIPDLRDRNVAVEENVVPVNVSVVNAIDGDKHGSNITDTNGLDNKTVPLGSESDDNQNTKSDSINEIGVTDQKEEKAAESTDTTISSGSFIILGAIMVAIIALLGYTVLKSHRQKQIQRDARKAKEEDPGTELKEFDKLLSPHQNGNGPASGIPEKEGLLPAKEDYDDIIPAGLNNHSNGKIAENDQPTRVNVPPKMANGNSTKSTSDQPAQVHDQPTQNPESVAVDLRYMPVAAVPFTKGGYLQDPSSSSGSLNSVDDRGSWVYGTSPLETTKIRMFIDEDSIPKTPIIIVKRGGETVDV